METIEEYEKRRKREVEVEGEAAAEVVLMDIACPVCGLEMHKTGKVFMRCPPKMEIRCGNCGKDVTVLA